MNHVPISPLELVTRKTLGCLREFGLAETVRRIWKEIFRKMGAHRKYSLDLSVINRHLTIGAAPKNRQRLLDLKEKEFTRIIDLRAERKEADILCSANALDVTWIPIYDDWSPKPTTFFETLNDIFAQLRDSSREKLLICCGAGEHRAPLAGLVALMAMGHPMDEAMNLIREARPVAELLPVYITSLQDYYRSKSTLQQIQQT